MTKEQIADKLIRIKALQEALKNEVTQLRQHIPLGEKIETALGEVNHVDSSRTSYDEAGLLQELNRLGIDPTSIGEVVVKVDRKKFASAVKSGDVPPSVVEDYTETMPIPTLRIKPKSDNQGLQKDTMERVASLVEK